MLTTQLDHLNNTKSQTIKLIETTSRTQKENGTRCFNDTLMNVNYLSYSSGYVRRSYMQKSNYKNGEHRVIYQLNKKRRVFDKIGLAITQRIMEHDSTKRLEMIAHSSSVYRKNNLK
jgi:hypothetical protein